MEDEEDTCKVVVLPPQDYPPALHVQIIHLPGPGGDGPSKSKEENLFNPVQIDAHGMNPFFICKTLINGLCTADA